MLVHRKAKDEAATIVFPIRTTGNALISGATALDSEISIFNEGEIPSTFVPCINEATELASTGCYYLRLNASELQTDFALIKTTTSSGSARTEFNLIDTRFAALTDTVTTILSRFDDYGLGNLDSVLLALEKALARRK